MTHITLTTFIVFFAIAAFGAVVFTLASFASRGGFSPTAEDDAALEETVPDDATEEGIATAEQPVRGEGMPSPFDS